VTAVTAVKRTEPSGSVTVFEDAKREINRVKKTLSLNSVSDIVEVNHAIVGPEVQLKPATGDPDQISHNELPRCDILELDCEGSETDVLKSISTYLERIFVETHGICDSPTHEVRDTLKELDYGIIHCDIGAENYALVVKSTIYMF